MDAASLAARLWPRGSGPACVQAYLLLDGARDARIAPMLRAGGLPCACLYAGALSPALAAAAPYLVQLDPQARLFNAIVPQAWGQAWGVFALAPPHVTLQQLRRHLRCLLRIRDERGQYIVFRYYDPRVLRAYVPSCAPDELARFMGPVTRLAYESADGEHLIEVAPPRAAPDHAGTQGASRHALLQGWSLRPSQLGVLRHDALRRFCEHLAALLRQAYPQLAGRMAPDELTAFVREGMAQARRWGLASDAALGDFLSLRLQLGAGFDQHPALREVLENNAIPAHYRVDALFHVLSGEQWHANTEQD